MREIKYKALVVKTQLDNLGSNMHLAGVSEYEEMINVQTISFDNGKVDYVTDEDMEEYSFADNSLKAVVQYTGLKDKNGKEIYEGDIVKISDHPFEGSMKINGNYEVGYNKYMELCCGSLLLFRNKHYAEVIGNIHESPQLVGESI
ncbi:hypothetical protein H8R29_23660 [Priestia megaterium]|uniref:YopX family protein n=1 Tax=Priestia megaterium (strain ATCC 14581 / DSM 32 / CCUG 1817 / JCM 2506 / NBRC 15308 / NCIMB 9376 / NCTC 10342 / NRRL B-14308 / VKM B-512 / Ford 19) TaxID=1348623 RepID=A0A0B6AWA1_PRIM2|nr:YopX family protein [Priestia megaterium]AJI25392.1 yopX family protein [Priestia megaterium NBRC 15308 = ATCC 14581]KGJ84216.1 hypothetical protein BMT_13120 [Priestia megaterium NBRC 15308 = ATCC 14581]MDR4230436.1 hypothetical protein [Priestia megaterium]MED3805586.1 YopX family protein [Priestia megaterium]MED4396300.1 YopX family protein [Priestia megaterium]